MIKSQNVQICSIDNPSLVRHKGSERCLEVGLFLCLSSDIVSEALYSHYL